MGGPEATDVALVTCRRYYGISARHLLTIQPHLTSSDLISLHRTPPSYTASLHQQHQQHASRKF